MPKNAILSDGTTANKIQVTSPTQTVNITGWNLSDLTITPPNAANFLLTFTAQEQDSEGNLSTKTSSSLAVTVLPQVLTIANVTASGVEGSAIGVVLKPTLQDDSGDTNKLASLVISAIPAGATLTLGANTFTANAQNGSSIDLVAAGWIPAGLTSNTTIQNDLKALTFTPANDGTVVLSVAATQADAEGDLSAAATSTATITVAPQAPVVTAPTEVTVVEGNSINLGLGGKVVIANPTGDSNSLTLKLSGIPTGTVLTDGTTAHTVTVGSTAQVIDVSSWTLANIVVKPINDTNFTVSIAATSTDAAGVSSKVATANEYVDVTPKAPSVASILKSGVEGSPIGIPLAPQIQQLTGDASKNSLASLVISAIPAGATLTLGTHSTTFGAGPNSIDLVAAGWLPAADLTNTQALKNDLASLAITAPNDANFKLTVSSTEADSDSPADISAPTTSYVTVTVVPLAPSVTVPASFLASGGETANATGAEGAPIALGIAVNTLSEAGANGDLPGDNAIKSVSISGLPAGATLSDGTSTNTATVPSSGVVNVTGWNYSGLQVTTTGDQNFTISITATEADSEGNLSSVTTTPEVVVVNPAQPTATWADGATGVSGVEGATISLGNLSVAPGGANSGNSIQSDVIAGLAAGDTLVDDKGNTETGASINVTGWDLANLSVITTNDADFSLTATATEVDSEGDKSANSATEAVAVAPVPPTVAWTNATSGATGVEGSTIALGALTIAPAGSDTPANAIKSEVITGLAADDTLVDDKGNTGTGASIDVTGWDLANLSVITTNDADFSLTATATETDGTEVSASASSTEQVVVTPEAPTLTWNATATGTEGKPISLGALTATANGLSGDSPANSIQSLTITGIPAGATLANSSGLLTQNGSVTLTASATQTVAQQLAGLTITPASDANFTLTATATEIDGNGDLSLASTPASETVVVDPLAPTVTISGTPEQGDTLTANVAGTDANVTLSYQWQENNGPDGAFLNIANATSSTYTAQEGDEGNNLQVVVTATAPASDGVNGGSTTAVSAPTSYVLDAPPVIDSLTITTGTIHDGETVQATATTADSDNTVTLQWFEVTVGAHGQDTFKLIKDDVVASGQADNFIIPDGYAGHELEVVATAINEQGQVTDSEVMTGLIALATPTIAADNEGSGLFAPSAVTKGSDGNNYVNVAHDTTNQTLTGFAEPGATVTISLSYNGGAATVVGTAQADPVLGGWSFPIDSTTSGPLASGTYAYTAVDSKTGDPSSATSTPFTFIVDDADPTATVAAATTPSGLTWLDAGKTITFTLTTNEPVTVGTGHQTPTLTLSNGGTATYKSGSGGDTLTFAYTVPSATKYNTSDLQVTGYTGSITDVAGNPLAPVAEDTQLKIDTVAPTVSLDKVDSNNVINLAEATNGVTITGSAGDSFSGALAGQEPTITIVNSQGATVDTLTAATGSLPGTWSAALTPTQALGLTDGTYTVDANLTDLAGNKATQASETLTVDETTPTASVSVSSSDVNVAAGTATVTFTFSEAPTDFSLNNVTAVGGSLSGLTPSSDGLSYTATFTGAANTDISNATVSVDNNWHEDNGNAGIGSSTTPFTVDTVTPTASVWVSSSDVNVAAGTATVTFTFSEAPTDFSLNNVTAVGGSLSGLTPSSDGLSYTATFTGAANTDISNATVSVDNNWHEDNGNAGIGSSTTPFTVDTVTPTASVSVSSSDVNVAAGTATVTFTFSEAPTDFSLNNVTAVGGSLSGLTPSSDGLSYTATFTGAANTDISNATVSVDNNWHEDNGNAGIGSSTTPFTVDTVTPTASVSVSSSDVNVAAGTATVTFTFSEAPTDFSLNNVTAVGGSLSGLTPSSDGLSYTATFTGAANTDISNATVSVDNNWHEDNGNAGIGSSTTPFTVDTVPPTVTSLTDVASNSLLTPNSPVDWVTGQQGSTSTVTFTLDMSEAVTIENPANTYLTLDTGTPGGTYSGTATAAYSGGSGTDVLTFTYDVAAGDGSGTQGSTLSVTGLDGAVEDAAGNTLGAVTATTGIHVDNLVQTLQVNGVTTNGTVATGASLVNAANDSTAYLNVIGGDFKIGGMSGVTQTYSLTAVGQTSGSGATSALFTETSALTEFYEKISALGLANGVYAVSGSATDLAGLYATTAAPFDITIETATPSITAPSSATVGLGQPWAVSGVSIAETAGNLSGETYTATLTDATGLLSATASGAASVTGNSSKDLVISGDLTDVNATLQSLTDTDSTNASDTIKINATDSFNNAATQQKIAVTVAGAPTITVPGAQTVGVNQPASIAPITVAESNAASGETFTVTVSDNNGFLSANTSAPNGGGSVTPSNGGETLTIQGSLSQVNADLATLTDTDSKIDGLNSDTITVTAKDSFGNSAPQQTIGVTANGLPSLTAPASQTIGQGKTAAISGVNISESGNPGGNGETFSATVSDANGLLNVSNADGATLTHAGTNDMTIAGTLAEVQTALGSLTDTDSTLASDTITVNASDSFNNTAIPQYIDITVQAPPAAPTITNSSVVNGYVNAAADTSSQTLSGTAAPGTTITIYNNGSLVSTPTITTNSSGAWSYNIGVLGNGPYSYTATATDAYGNTSPASTAETFTVDKTVPTITDSSDVGGYVNAANDTSTQALTGTAAPNTQVSIYLNGSSTAAFTPTANSSGVWTQTIGSLANGSYSYVAKDAAGNSSTALAFTVDKTVPTIADSSDVGGYVNAANDTSTQALTGTAAPNTQVSIYLNGSSTAAFTPTANSSGVWTQTIGSLANGSYSYVAKDAAGNSSTALAFTVDKTVPTIADSSDVGGYVNAANDTSTQALTGTAAPNTQVSIYLNGSSTAAFTPTANSSGVWTQTIGSLANGSYSYVAKDAAGNSSTALAFTVDKTVPTVGFTLDANSSDLSALTNNAVLNKNDEIGTFAAANDPNGGTFSYSLSGTAASLFSLNSSTGVLSVGAANITATSTLEQLTVTATDSAGNATAHNFQIYIGSSGNDTVTLTSVTNFNAATPTVVYDYTTGNGQSTDTITTGATSGNIWIVPGAGGTMPTNLTVDSSLATGGTPTVILPNFGAGLNLSTSLQAIGTLILDGQNQTYALAGLNNYRGYVLDNTGDTISFPAGYSTATINVNSEANTTIKYQDVSASPVGSGADVISNIVTGTGATKIDFSAIGGGVTAYQGYITSSTNVAAHSVAAVVSGSNTLLYVNNTGSQVAQSSAAMEIILSGVTTLSGASITTGGVLTLPAGVAGSAINMALTDPSGAVGPVTVTVSGVPSDWKISGGAQNADGSWTVTTSDPSALTVTTPSSFTGAEVLQVSESWTNADGSTGLAIVGDNVEAYAKGSPIFALSGDDNLTGSGGNDTFVFAQPIGNDVIHDFNVASDKIELAGFSGAQNFAAIQGDISSVNGNAVITLGAGETITLDGVSAASLTASDFAVGSAVSLKNGGAMTLGDGASLPIGGAVQNGGSIDLNSTGDLTNLQILSSGAQLSGAGKVVLSDNSENLISGTTSTALLTNLNNTISGAGDIGGGQMSLINEGVIDATGTNGLVIDTGANSAINTGTLEATGAGGLTVASALVSTGKILANDADVTLEGAVSGKGTATISGSGVLDYAAASSEATSFASGATGELQLGAPAPSPGRSPASARATASIWRASAHRRRLASPRTAPGPAGF